MTRSSLLSFAARSIILFTLMVIVPQEADAQRSARRARKHDRLDERIDRVEDSGKMTGRLEKRDKRLHRSERRAVRDGVIRCAMGLLHQMNSVKSIVNIAGRNALPEEPNEVKGR